MAKQNQTDMNSVYFLGYKYKTHLKLVQFNLVKIKIRYIYTYLTIYSKKLNV